MTTFIHCNSTWIFTSNRRVSERRNGSTRTFISICCPISLLQGRSRPMHQQGNRDQGCATTTALPPHHSRLCTPSLAPPVARIPPHPMPWRPTLFWEPKFWPSRKKSNSQWLLHRSIHWHKLQGWPIHKANNPSRHPHSVQKWNVAPIPHPAGATRPCILMNYHILIIEWSICCWEFKAWIPLNSKQNGHLVRWIQPNPSPFDSRLNLLLA